jgi:predicted transposase YbfD/YdcC
MRSPPCLRSSSALELAGAIVTADAMHCQKATAREIKEADADYVLALKANQGLAYAEIKAYLDDAVEGATPELAVLEMVEKGHGRIETRRCLAERTSGLVR